MTSAELKLLDVKEAAAYLHGCSIGFIRLLIANKELPMLKVGKRFMVTAGDLDRWIERSRGRPGEGDLPRTKGKERGRRYLKTLQSA